MTEEIKQALCVDAACSGNPGPGGWGAILRYNGKEKEIAEFMKYMEDFKKEGN